MSLSLCTFPSPGLFPNLFSLSLSPTPLCLSLFLIVSFSVFGNGSIWSLKALDFHVISDEEIIEDAAFGGHFAAMHPAFRYNPMPQSKKVDIPTRLMP